MGIGGSLLSKQGNDTSIGKQNPFYKTNLFWACLGFIVGGVVVASVMYAQMKQEISVTKQITQTTASTTSERRESKTEVTSTSQSTKQDKKLALQGMARLFGTKSVVELQDMFFMYEATKIDAGMQYVWRMSDDALVRIDTADGYTNVYKYDPVKQMKTGESLFAGQTVVQKFGVQ